METFTSNMLTIIEQQDFEHNRHMDNTRQILILLLLKVFLDGGAMFMCCFGSFLSFLNLCSISIFLVDLVLAVFMVATLWLDVEMSHAAICYLMANFSAAFSVLPVPMFCLGILDYKLEYASVGSKCMKLVRNLVLILLMWSGAGIYAHATVNDALHEQTRNVKYIVCEIRESKTVAHSVIMLTAVMFFTLLPYLSQIPPWIKEAHRICEATEKVADTRSSDLMIDLTTEENTKHAEGGLVVPRPSMGISLMICFGLIWMPFLAVTTFCDVAKFRIPAFLSVNLLWVQCVNSLLAGVVFWLKSDTVGPYNILPENVCFWQAYWHLSTGTEMQHQLPVVSKFNPSKGNKSMPFYI